MHKLSYRHFWLSVTPFDAGHTVATLLGRQYVSHQGSWLSSVGKLSMLSMLTGEMGGTPTDA